MDCTQMNKVRRRLQRLSMKRGWESLAITFRSPCSDAEWVVQSEMISILKYKIWDADCGLLQIGVWTKKSRRASLPDGLFVEKTTTFRQFRPTWLKCAIGGYIRWVTKTTTHIPANIRLTQHHEAPPSQNLLLGRARAGRNRNEIIQDTGAGSNPSATANPNDLPSHYCCGIHWTNVHCLLGTQWRF